MKKNNAKSTPVNHSKSIHSESEAQKIEAVVKDIARIMEKEFRRENAILEEINSYTDGKQIVLTNLYKMS